VCIFCSAPRRGDGSIAMSVCVCLSASIPAELFIRSSPNDLRMLSMAVARSCSGSVAIGFVMYSGLSMTHNGHRGMSIPLQRVTSLHRRAQAKIPAVLYWLRRVLSIKQPVNQSVSMKSTLLSRFLNVPVSVMSWRSERRVLQAAGRNLILQF